MRLPAWMPLAGSVGLLLAVGALGFTMNQSTLGTAERVHRTDTAALATNNATLANQYLRQSANELTQAVTLNRPALLRDYQPDQDLLQSIVDRSPFFGFGAEFTDRDGTAVTTVRGMYQLPAASDSGFEPLWRQIDKGQVGYSSTMTGYDGGWKVGVVAVGVPVMSGDLVRGGLVGFIELRSSLLQAYILGLSTGSSSDGVIDQRGHLVSALDQELIGTPAEPAIVAAAAHVSAGRPTYVEYTSNGTSMVAVLSGGIGDGWVYYHAETVSSFYGPIRSRTGQINLVLLIMVLLAIAGLAVLNHRAATVRRRAESRFTALVQNATDVITVLDARGRIIYDSPSVATTLGYPLDARIGHSGGEVLHPEERDRAGGLFERVIARPGTMERLHCRMIRADGEIVWMDVSISNLLDDPAIRGVVINARDITDHRRLQDHLSYQASHDTLTGLANRRLFDDRLKTAAESRARSVAVLFVDLDKFKEVNDVYGHEAGDELLRQVGLRLTTCVRAQDTAARIGGDEFVILLDGIRQRAEVEAVAARIVDAVGQPFDIFGRWICVGVSVGVSIGTDGWSATSLLQAADGAMYQAKQAGGLRYRVFAA